MPAYSASAPGKIILLGEHAVVYGYPAIAIPVPQVRAKAIVMAEPRSPRGQVQITARNVGLETTLERLPEDHPLKVVIRKSVEAMQVSHIPACSLTISSTIPVAGGMGSGAAVCVASLRALSALLGRPLSDKQVSDLVYQAELIYHGNPSGIDNNVIAHARTLYFVKGQPLEFLNVKQPFTLVIGNTGIESPTSTVVGSVHLAWENDRERYAHLFESVGVIASAGRKAVQAGTLDELGMLMDRNQALLQEMGVSSFELDRLVQAAKSAGALGAKLSGAGRGGSMIALVTAETANQVVTALLDAGAVGTILTEVAKT
jgi:mevalonate kinase